MDNKNSERVELHCHSVYSTQDGVSSIKDIIDYAAKNRMPAVAITDHESVAGFKEASYYARLYEGLKVIYGMEACVVNDLDTSVEGNEEYIKKSPSFHVTFLIRNEEGKQNLFELMSLSEEKYKAKRTRIPWSAIKKYRKGLLIGSACEVGELYLAVRKNEPDEVLEEIASRYDYIEVQPAENKLYFIDEDEASYEERLDYIRQYDKKVIEIAERLGKPVVATSDAHFVTPEEAIVRSVLQRYVGYDSDDQLDIHFRTTEEMLQCFGYLGENQAHKIVVENSNKIADMIENVQITYQAGEHYPVLDNAYNRLKDICDSRLKEIYGEEVPREVLDQLDWELHSMMESGSDSIMLLSKELVDESGLPSYEIGYRGCIGGSLVAFLCGITCVNPLESKMPLYPEFLLGVDGSKFVDIALNFPTEVREQVWDACNDLEEIGSAFHAGTIKTLSETEAIEAVDEYEQYHGFHIETDKKNWIVEHLTQVVDTRKMNAGAMLLVPEDYEITEFSPLARMNEDLPLATGMDYHYLDNLFWFNILTNDHINMVYQLMRRTGVSADDISLEDIEVGKLLGGKGKVNTDGIPGFESERLCSIAKEYGLENFTDMIQVFCLMYGTNVWENNAEILIQQEGMTKDSIIASREDIFDCLEALGFSREDAFGITEFVRKGKANPEKSKWQEYKKMIDEAGAPKWFIWSCEQMQYVFSRAHAYIYALHIWWIAWFKLYYPKEFAEVAANM